MGGVPSVDRRAADEDDFAFGWWRSPVGSSKAATYFSQRSPGCCATADEAVSSAPMKTAVARMRESVTSIDALSRHRPRETRPPSGARSSHSERHARRRFHCRRRVSVQHGAGAAAARRLGEMGRDLLLRDAARRGASVLGGLLRSAVDQGRPRAQPMPPRERHRVLGVLVLRLHRATRGTAQRKRRALL